MKRDLHIRHFFKHPQAKVWEAVTDSDLLGKWYLPNDLDPEYDEEFTFRSAPEKGWNGVTYCELTHFEPKRRLAFTYRGTKGGSKAGKHSSVFGALDTMVRIALVPEENGTYLAIDHEGFRGLKQIFKSFVIDGSWRAGMRRLEGVLKDMK